MALQSLLCDLLNGEGGRRESAALFSQRERAEEEGGEMKENHGMGWKGMGGMWEVHKVSIPFRPI